MFAAIRFTNRQLYPKQLLLELPTLAKTGMIRYLNNNGFINYLSPYYDCSRDYLLAVCCGLVSQLWDAQEDRIFIPFDRGMRFHGVSLLDYSDDSLRLIAYYCFARLVKYNEGRR